MSAVFCYICEIEMDFYSIFLENHALKNPVVCTGLFEITAICVTCYRSLNGTFLDRDRWLIKSETFLWNYMTLTKLWRSTHGFQNLLILKASTWKLIVPILPLALLISYQVDCWGAEPEGCRPFTSTHGR